MCSGKIYYDLIEAREKYKNDKFDFKCISTRKKQYAAKNRNMAAKKVDTDYIGFFDAEDIM